MKVTNTSKASDLEILDGLRSRDNKLINLSLEMVAGGSELPFPSPVRSDKAGVGGLKVWPEIVLAELDSLPGSEEGDDSSEPTETAAARFAHLGLQTHPTKTPTNRATQIGTTNTASSNTTAPRLGPSKISRTIETKPITTGTFKNPATQIKKKSRKRSWNTSRNETPNEKCQSVQRKEDYVLFLLLVALLKLKLCRAIGEWVDIYLVVADKDC